MTQTRSAEGESLAGFSPEEAADQIMDAMVPVTNALSKGAHHLTRSLRGDLALPPIPQTDLGSNGDTRAWLSYLIDAASGQGAEQIYTVGALHGFVNTLGGIDLAWLRGHPGILPAALDHTWQSWEADEGLSRKDAKRFNQMVEDVRDNLLGIGNPDEGHPVWLVLAANRPALAYLDFWSEVAGYGAGQMEATIRELAARSQGQGEEQLAQIETVLQEVLWQGNVFMSSQSTIDDGLDALAERPLGKFDIGEEIRQSVENADILRQLIDALRAQDEVLPDLLTGTGQIKFITGGAASLVNSRQMIHNVLAGQAEIANMGLIGIRLSAMSMYDLSVAAIIERLNLQRMALSRIQTDQRGALQAAIAALHQDSRRLFSPLPDEQS